VPTDVVAQSSAAVANAILSADNLILPGLQQVKQSAHIETTETLHKCRHLVCVGNNFRFSALILFPKLSNINRQPSGAKSAAQAYPPSARALAGLQDQFQGPVRSGFLKQFLKDFSEL
jgi:hypothetical protein